MKFLKIFTSRFYIYITLLLIQIIYLYSFATQLVEYNKYINILSIVFSWIIVIWLVNKDENPNYKVVWIILVLSIPHLGGLLYLLLGNKRPSRILKSKIQPAIDYTNQYLHTNTNIDDINDQILVSSKYLEDQHFPIYQNTQVKYYSLGDYAYQDLLTDLKNAKSFIFMEYFIMSDGLFLQSILKILKDKVKEGVDVRVIYDDFGSFSTIPKHFKKTLKEYGIKYVCFNRFVPYLSFSMNHRDHRKITVIDGSIGYSGGFNIADEYINGKERYGHWKDTGVRIEGEAVWSLTCMFLSTYYAYHPIDDHIDHFRPVITENTEGYVLPYGDQPLDEEHVGEDVYLNLITRARHSIRIMTPYFIIDDTMLKALINASHNGIKIELYTPHIPDKELVFRVTRSYYSDLISNGIDVYEYLPGFLHSKVMLVDDKVATVGTINFDYRSLYLHFEGNILLYKTPCISEIKADFKHIQTLSQKIEQQQSQRFKGILEAILRLFAPLL